MPEATHASAPDWDTGFGQAHDAALRFLSYRPRSEAEVRRRLLRRYPSHLVDRVIAALREQHYLDDTAVARQWRMSRERLRPRSLGMLRQELLRLGVVGEVVEEVLEGFDAEDNAYRAGRKLALRLEGSDYPQFRRRLWGYLRRRGFGGPLVGETVERLWRELADPFDGSVDADADEE